MYIILFFIWCDMLFIDKNINDSDKKKWVTEPIISKLLGIVADSQPNIDKIADLSEALLSICDYVEQYTGRAIVKKTITASVNRRNSALFRLPYQPIISIQSISKKYKENKIQSLQIPLDITNSTNYLKGYLSNLMNDEILTVVYIAGYSSLSEVPSSLQYALVGHLYKFYSTRLMLPPDESVAVYNMFRCVSI
ncbi:hypothetical protein CAXC1_150007 [Candidatus Xenohaliotis californiensis]|uniref:Uncharacterized protein n=2 Tax=Candidatus Xenohaliotis californiensis TaxID=84677 RepID=A0ABP0EUP4_9RICK|nr:hypothetical protein CAXC1_150007 [Candidatus Xenohaliotis californiensis]